MAFAGFMFQISFKGVVGRRCPLIGGILFAHREHVTHRPNLERVNMQSIYLFLGWSRREKNTLARIASTKYPVVCISQRVFGARTVVAYLHAYENYNPLTTSILNRDTIRSKTQSR